MGAVCRYRYFFITGALAVVVSLLAAACSAGISQKDYDSLKSQLQAKDKDYDTLKSQLQAKEKDVAQIQMQLSSTAPAQVVQAGQLQPATAVAEPTGWDTSESIRGGLRLLATYDSGGANAWDPVAHPLVYMTSEGMGYGHRPSKTNKLPGVQVIDAGTKKVVTSALFDLGNEVMSQPHGLGVSPDGKWIYLGFSDRVNDTKETRNLILIVNARTLKLDKVLTHPVQRLHHILGFTDWTGKDRVLLEFGFGSDGGPHFLLDPKGDNRVVRAITVEDTRYQMGHPYITPDPTGKFLYVSLELSAWREEIHETGGIAKFDLETGVVKVIPGLGAHPLGTTSTADGKYTYVNDAENSLVYKIDNATNKIAGHTSAGVAGPYGLRLGWDETKLYTIGKGEGSHNTGGVVGVIDTKSFTSARDFNQPIQTGGAVEDHGILHPDPKLNELWISSAGTWETIVLDLSTREVKARIPSPHGGDTHSGAFVRYASDFSGELMADHGGPKATMLKTEGAMAAAAALVPAAAQSSSQSTPAPVVNNSRGDLIAKGKLIYDKTAGGVGCASCHGPEGKGGASASGGAPDIRSATEAKIRVAVTGGVPMMSFIKLNEEEIVAVAAYLRDLNH